MAGPDLLERIDRIMAELAALRAAVAGGSTIVEAEAGGTIVPPADDLADGNLLDTHAAQERFGYPQDTIRKWCRTENLGVMRGGRWLVSVPRLRQRLNGK
jgi:hypothetical protein